MNRRFLAAVFILTYCFLFVSKSDACELPPIAEISNPYSQTICVGGSVSFDGSTSYDQDEGGDSIDVYYWNYSEDSDWHEDGATPSHTFNTADPYWVYLYVKDDEEVMSEDYDYCIVYVVKVNDVEEDKTLACVNETVTFTANSYPSEKPLGCIEWEKRYKEKSTDDWGDWETADGGDNTAVLNTDTPGFYKYQARNGSDDSWKESSEVTVVKVDKIQYYDPDDGYTNIEFPLFVRTGTTVTFKAIPLPSDASWPSGKPVWGGTSGASGSGETTDVTFSTLSSTITDYMTVTAECGNTETADIVVFDFEGTFTPDDNFDDRSTEYYGIEEEVALSFETDPWSVTAGQAGGLKWTKLDGVGELTNAGSDGTADYDAEHLDGAVTFRITIESGPSKGKFESYGKDIILPSGTRMTRVNNKVWHVWGFASAGIALDYWLDPTNVSFKNLDFGEGSCPSTNVSGFYLKNAPWLSDTPPTNSYPNGTQNWGHLQVTFGAILGGNITTGCRVQLGDEAGTGLADPYAAGSSTWSIPTQYIDDTSTRHTFGSNQNHVSTFQANGDATQSKGGQSGSAALNDQSSGYY